jgi:hypothetical protein
VAAIEMVTAQFTAATVAGSTATPAAGDSFTIRNSPLGCQLIQTHAVHQTGAAGAPRDTIRSPRMHDSTNAIRIMNISTAQAANVGVARPQIPYGVSEPLVSQDTLTFILQGTAVAGDIESRSVLFYYPQLPGSDQNLIDYVTYQKKAVHLLTNEVGAIAAGTAGGYSTPTAINAAFALLKANTNYALLGITSSLLQCSVTVRGADTANLRVGVPGSLDPTVNCGYFLDLAKSFGLPMIPVLNSANAPNTFVELVNDENAASPIITLYLAELRG